MKRRRPSLSINDNMRKTMYSRRAMLLGGAQLGVAGLLGARMAWISIAENERWNLLSESNRVQLSLIPPRRGWIVDRAGQPIAMNRSDFRVDLIPDRLQEPDRVIGALTELLDLTEEDIARIRADLDEAAGYQPVQVADGLEWEKFAAVNVRLPDLPGVAPLQGFSRYYPAGPAVAHLVGYVGAPSREEYEESRDPILMVPGFKVGKDMLEKTMEEHLRGEPGARRAEVTARGELVRELETRPDVSGDVLRLTIDAGLQAYAARRLGPESGSVVVMDTQTGGVLAMTSMPAYDPNSFSDGISHLEWNMLSEDDHVPLRNKTLQGLYPPGSTIKPMNALALLGENIDPEETVTCAGRTRIAGGNFHCWRRGGHGSVNMNRAIAESCDIYFYQMGVRVGMQPFADTARSVGLGERFEGLPVPYQYFGTVPDPAWKQQRFGEEWQTYDTVNATIGQGYMLTNPLQLAVMAARLASGRNITPYLISGETPRRAGALNYTAEHLAIVRQGMSDVVNGRGTAGRARLPVEGVELAGKTGTAQVRRITMAERRSGVRSNASLPWELRDHGLFVCYAPTDNPRYAAAVVIEHGGGSGSAYPVARDVLTYLYDQERAIELLESYEAGWGGDITERMALQEAEYRARQRAAEAGTLADPLAERSARNPETGE
ncbi:penicillin-binding protein 2 [Parasphingopyxis algicola]|uniref:penicillin-binding protein 2 n=1 Tax=Parasphingopyxis algicola TaxID=2026624 RepID=UPI003CCD3E8E